MKKTFNLLFGIHFDISTSLDWPKPCLLCGHNGHQLLVSFMIRILNWIIPVATVNFCISHLYTMDLISIANSSKDHTEKISKTIKDQKKILEDFDQEMREKWEKKEEKAQ